MAAEPIFPDEFKALLSRFYARITMYVEGRADSLMNLLRVLQLDFKDFKVETLERFDRLEGNVATAQADIAILKEDNAALRRDVTDIIAFQHTLMDTFKGFATDILKRMDSMQQQMVAMQQQMATQQQEMRDGFAAQAERHNELMIRVDRLERRDNPPQD